MRPLSSSSSSTASSSPSLFVCKLHARLDRRMRIRAVSTQVFRSKRITKGNIQFSIQLRCNLVTLSLYQYSDYKIHFKTTLFLLFLYKRKLLESSIDAQWHNNLYKNCISTFQFLFLNANCRMQMKVKSSNVEQIISVIHDATVSVEHIVNQSHIIKNVFLL